MPPETRTSPVIAMFSRTKRQGSLRTRWGRKLGTTLSMIGAGIGLGIGFGLGAGIALGTRTGSTVADRLHLARLRPRTQNGGRVRLGRIRRKIPLMG